MDSSKKFYKECVNCKKVFKGKTTYYTHRKACVLNFPNNAKDPFKTCECGKKCFSKSNYYTHIKNCEEARVKQKTSENNSINFPNTKHVNLKTCECGKIFSKKCTYYNHSKNCEQARSENKNSENYLCQEENCSFVSHLKVNFLNHLKESHSIACEEEIKTFQGYAEFEDWKESYEKATAASFRVCYIKKKQIGMYKHFICNRSGQYTSKRTGKRSIKKQGLVRIGHKCTASIKLHQSEDSPTIQATIYGMHYGHDNNLAHIRIAKSDRLNIAHQLSLGVEKPRILQNVLSVNSTEHLERQHLITRKDLNNIQRSFGIKQLGKHPEDAINADACVSEDLEAVKSLLLYKEKGALYYQNHESLPLDRDEGKGDVMTIGENICIDVTHETSTPPLDRSELSFKDITSEVGTELMNLKSNLVSRVTALIEMIQHCDSKNLLLIAKAHITSTASVLKLGNGELGKNNRNKNIPSNKNVKKRRRLCSPKGTPTRIRKKQ